MSNNSDVLNKKNNVILIKMPYVKNLIAACPICNEYLGEISEKEISLSFDHCTMCEAEIKETYEKKDIEEMIKNVKKPFLEIDFYIDVVNQKYNEKSKIEKVFFVKITHIESMITVTKKYSNQREARDLAMLEMYSLLISWKNGVKDISEMSQEELVEKLEKEGIKVVSKEELMSVIDNYDEKTRKYTKTGIYISFPDEVNNLYTIVDNSNGEAFCEDFMKLSSCIRWLKEEDIEEIIIFDQF